MSMFNKILVIGALAIGLQAGINASEYKVELAKIVHFTHKLEQQEDNTESTELAQWLQKEIISNKYCSYHTLTVMTTIIDSNCSMNEKTARLLDIKDQQEATEKQEIAQKKEQEARWEKERLVSNIKFCGTMACFMIAGPAIMQTSLMVGENWGKKLVARLNKPAAATASTKKSIITTAGSDHNPWTF